MGSTDSKKKKVNVPTATLVQPSEHKEQLDRIETKIDKLTETFRVFKLNYNTNIMNRR